MTTETHETESRETAPEAEIVLSNADIVSRILGFCRFCAGQASDRLDQAAISRGWIDPEGHPTDDGRALIHALMSRESAYGIYRLLV